MRITSGTAKGHRLRVPQVPDLRPTKEMVRQAIFSILQDGIENAIVLDLYAGTGSLGIEALSRGASFADFVDVSKEACRAMKENLKHARLLGKAKVHETKAQYFLRSCPDHTYHLIFADPPYALEVGHTLTMASSKLKGEGVLVYLHGQDGLIGNVPGLYLEETRRYGITGVSFFTVMRKYENKSLTF